MRNRNLEKVGLVGSVPAALCCLGFGPAIAFLSATEARALIKDRIPAPPPCCIFDTRRVGPFLLVQRPSQVVRTCPPDR